MSIERHLVVSNSDIGSVDAALSWVVQTLDRDFRSATMQKIAVEQVLRSEGDGWRPVWTAAVSGLIEDNHGN